jgi:LuxR family transcriptional regulator
MNAPELGRVAPTRRELQILGLVADGMTTKEIGHELCLSDRTVDNHLRRLTSRLDARSRAHAVAIALRQRLLESN